MAVKATFSADFGSFQAQVRAATDSFVGFQTAAKNADETLTAMVDKFSGVKLLSQATVMVEAIDRIGGASKLTAQELQQVGRVAAEAVEKFKAMSSGPVPQAWMDLAKYAKDANKEIQNTGTSVSSLASELQGFAGSIAAAFSIRAMVNFAYDTLQAARSMRSLSYETGLTVEEVQLLGQVSKEFGVTSDQMARAVDILTKRIAGDETSAVAAIHSFGMSLDEIKGKAPLDMLRTVLEHINQLGSEFEKQHVAAGLFGERMGRIMVRLAQDFDTTYDHLKAKGDIFADDQAKRLAKAADQWDEVVRHAKLLAAGPLDTVVSGLGAINDALDKSQSKWAVFKAIMADYILASQGDKRAGQALAGLIAGPAPPAALNLASFGPGGKDFVGPIQQPLTDADKLAAILNDTVKEISDHQREILDSLWDQNKLTKENAEIFGVSADQAERYKRKLDDIVRVQEQQYREHIAMINLETEFTNRAIKNLDELNTKEDKRLEIQTDIIGKLVIESQLDVQKLQKRGLGPGATDDDPVIQAVIKRNERLRDLEREQENFQAEQDKRNERLRKANFAAGLSIFGGGEGGPFAGMDRRQLDQSVAIAAVWADFDDELKKIRESGDGVAGSFDRITAAATKAAKAAKDLTDSAKFGEGETLLPWSKLGPKPLEVKPIVPGSFGGVGPINMNIQISGVWDPASADKAGRQIAEGWMKASGRQFGSA